MMCHSYWITVTQNIYHTYIYKMKILINTKHNIELGINFRILVFKKVQIPTKRKGGVKKKGIFVLRVFVSHVKMLESEHVHNLILPGSGLRDNLGSQQRIWFLSCQFVTAKMNTNHH